jgi:uncharacterized membrane protein
MSMKWPVSPKQRLGVMLAVSTLTCVVLFLVAAIRNHSLYFDYLMWNLFLAWIPFGLMVWLRKTLRTKLWSSWPALALTTAFVGFLPNTFYMITDVIHLQEVRRVDMIFDVIMFSSFIINAFALGLLSTYLVHMELRKRFRVHTSWLLLMVLVMAVSFAIYIGRDLRWNTWDILINPASILFEISDRLMSPFAHPELFSTTFGFFALIISTYVAFWQGVQVVRADKVSD